jgi:predicted nucleic acid-binding protein
MIALIDSNVILDSLLKNEGFYKDAEAILVMSEKDVFQGYVSASAITDIHYIARKAHGKDRALELIDELLDNIHIALIDESVIRKAVDLKWNDFEESVQFSAGEILGADYIVTRDPKGFAESAITVITPKSFIDLLAPEEQIE